ncbi:MAG TPA: alpha/beta fold hydrolase [Actinomycetota bacterium]|nr:alpha/beta fold hydrolase [Actinomycetota bacterium]
MDPSRTRPLVVLSQDVPEDRPVLIAFPHAGAPATAYRPWADRLPQLRVVGVQLAGRQNRLRDVPATRVSDVVDEVVPPILAQVAEIPFVLYGHSFGAVVAYEVARALQRRAVPAALVVSGARAPHRPRRGAGFGHLSDAELIAAVARLGGIPNELLNKPQILKDLVPALRADVAAAEAYRHEDGDRVACPLLAFTGAADERVSPDACEAWGAHAGGVFRWRVVPGSHFFVHDPAFAPILLEELAGAGVLSR